MSLFGTVFQQLFCVQTKATKNRQQEMGCPLIVTSKTDLLELYGEPGV